ncbi:LysR family transcriptional regulator [Lichenihabitans sp. Uapishka_5]|uniref:LysR family transcriptional regulator n=1 Tax=Lichenihabitans sp. Uapishka_5 TaxID=3037302 RepID=UPI0029E7CC4C|nr:LysR family transcriptional regulator [Lichenihabitans sp. Uapishka_5]MDX7953587.1 LysR family transcriptional regulator [Lichenihabitans sp. Uapishka_5]
MADLNSLIVFAKVAEALSFTEAARRLEMPVSTVSRRIADLEKQLAVQLLERSTRTLRLTAVGHEVLDYARRAAEANDGVEHVVANQRAAVRGLVRLAAPPSISDSVVAPIIAAFRQVHGAVRFEAVITEQVVEFIADRIDLEIHVGPVEDTSLVVRRLLAFRHRLVASPAYLSRAEAPRHPKDLLQHPILAFSHFRREYAWEFSHADGRNTERLVFVPQLGINDYVGVTAGLLAGGGIGDLPPIVQPELMRAGRLVEVMPDWHLPVFDLVILHPATRYQSRAVRLFKEFASRMIGELFPELAT